MHIYNAHMEIKKPEICLAHALRRADRIVSQLYNDRLAHLGIRITQFSILRALHFKGSTTASEIKNVLTMEQATISRALKPLIRDGYILVSEGASKREKALSLTQVGKKLYQQALGPWNDVQTKLRNELGDGDDDLIIALSQKIVSTIKH